nr:uncharacterized protein LOC109185560 [Ipomoea batatas]
MPAPCNKDHHASYPLQSVSSKVSPALYKSPKRKSEHNQSLLSTCQQKLNCIENQPSGLLSGVHVANLSCHVDLFANLQDSLLFHSIGLLYALSFGNDHIWVCLFFPFAFEMLQLQPLVCVLLKFVYVAHLRKPYDMHDPDLVLDETEAFSCFNKTTDRLISKALGALPFPNLSSRSSQMSLAVLAYLTLLLMSLSMALFNQPLTIALQRIHCCKYGELGFGMGFAVLHDIFTGATSPHQQRTSGNHCVDPIELEDIVEPIELEAASCSILASTQGLELDCTTAAG